jgi:hypothetical protein
MKLKHAQIYDAKTAIRMVDLTANPGKESMRISEKFCEPLFVLLDRIETQRVKLIEKYGTKTEGGGSTVSPNSANWDNFVKDFGELLEEEIDLEIDLLPRDLLERANLSPAEVRALRPFTVAPQHLPADSLAGVVPVKEKKVK